MDSKKKKLILITGGSRSGKSRFALNKINAMKGEKTFIATCPSKGVGMDERIVNHKKEREGSLWNTIEEELDLSHSIQQSKGNILIDCLTLWVNNLMHHHALENKLIDEKKIQNLSGELIESMSKYENSIVCVTNEVGLGIIPNNPESRLFVDLAGRCNQCMAEFADEVYFCMSGIPQKIKG